MQTTQLANQLKNLKRDIQIARLAKSACCDDSKQPVATANKWIRKLNHRTATAAPQ